MNAYSIDPQTIVDFWREIGPDRWFAKDDDLDETIRQRFADVHERAAAGELDRWAEQPNGALALVLILDQFSRNLFRDSPRMYAADDKALSIARRAVARGDQHHVGDDLNQFLAMPMMHAEDLAAQDECVLLMREFGPDNLEYAEHHRDIVARFGRFPHRNAILGRTSTPDEEAYLAADGFKG